jgi:hypothetical protein
MPPTKLASRANAQLSTDPVTESGQSRSSQNSFKHPPEDREGFERHNRLIREALSPVGTLEDELAQAIAEDQWRLKCARALEIDSAAADGRTSIEKSREIQLLALYIQRIQRTLAKNTAKFQAMRSGGNDVRAQDQAQALLLTELA